MSQTWVKRPGGGMAELNNNFTFPGLGSQKLQIKKYANNSFGKILSENTDLDVQKTQLYKLYAVNFLAIETFVLDVFDKTF